MKNLKRSVLTELKDIVGKEHASSEAEDCIAYSRDISRPLGKPRMPDYVVLPGTGEEVQELILLANKYKILVTVAAQSTTMAGLTVPSKGGIVLSVLRLDKLQINEETMTAAIGAGVCMEKMLKGSGKG